MTDFGYCILPYRSNYILGERRYKQRKEFPVGNCRHGFRRGKEFLQTFQGSESTNHEGSPLFLYSHFTLDAAVPSHFTLDAAVPVPDWAPLLIYRPLPSIWSICVSFVPSRLSRINPVLSSARPPAWTCLRLVYLCTTKFCERKFGASLFTVSPITGTAPLTQNSV